MCCCDLKKGMSVCLISKLQAINVILYLNDRNAVRSYSHNPHSK
uniref:Uncharacterized protein n=1 Tax=Anguilla anguilla TaxID=7936 RepID=A0A0E9U8W1_ANGAN